MQRPVAWPVATHYADNACGETGRFIAANAIAHLDFHVSVPHRYIQATAAELRNASRRPVADLIARQFGWPLAYRTRHLVEVAPGCRGPTFSFYQNYPMSLCSADIGLAASAHSVSFPISDDAKELSVLHPSLSRTASLRPPSKHPDPTIHLGCRHRHPIELALRIPLELLRRCIPGLHLVTEPDLQPVTEVVVE